MGFAMWPHRCVIRVHAPAEDLADRVEGIVTPVDEPVSLLGCERADMQELEEAPDGRCSPPGCVGAW